MSGAILVTGAKGFVGSHLLAEVGEHAVAADADVTEPEAVAEAVRSVRPAAVVHLAARSSVASSWQRASEAWVVNAVGTVNVLEAVRDESPEARALVVSTAEVYGRAPKFPTPEDAPIAPLSPYAASKAAAEIAARRTQRADGLDVVVARSFPHAGPGQDERFAIGSWVHQIARLELEGGGSVHVGDLSVQRDIVDVRDVCRAYRLLLDPAVTPDTYNVASGRAVSLKDVLDILVGLAGCPLSIESDPGRVRPADVSILCGDSSRLAAATGWKPQIPLEKTLADALEQARATVKQQTMTATA